MAEHDVKIKISEEGSDKTIQGIGGIAKAFKSLLAPIIGVRRAVSGLFAALGTVGFVIHGISMIVDSVKQLYDWFERAKESLKEMANARIIDGFAKALDRAAERGKILAETTAKATAEAIKNLKEMQQFDTTKLNAGTAVLKAQTDLDERIALSNAKTKEERDRISEEFSLKRAEAARRENEEKTRINTQSVDSQIGIVKSNISQEEYYKDKIATKRGAIYYKLQNEDLSQKSKEKLEELLDGFDKEIAASKDRINALKSNLESLKNQKVVIDQDAEESKLRLKEARKRVENARAERRRLAMIDEAANQAKKLADETSSRLDEIKKSQSRDVSTLKSEGGVKRAALNLEEQRALAGVTDPDERTRISDDYELMKAEIDRSENEQLNTINRQSVDDQIAAAKESLRKETKFQSEKQRNLVEGMDKEIQASEKRAKALEDLIRSLENEKKVIDNSVEESRLKRDETYAKVQNERNRRAMEEFVKLSEKSAKELDSLQIESKEKELSKAEDALKAEPSVALANDRITAMGGFATAGAAAISGIAAGPDRTYEELRAQKDLLKQEIEQLKKIVRNTEDAGATFQ